MEACWNEAQEGAPKIRPEERDDDHEAFFRDCMGFRGYKK